MQLPKTPKGRRSRQALLDSARRAFSEQGFASTRVQDIVDGAGLSLGAFYRYFTDRRDVLLALLREFFADLYQSSRSPWHPGVPTQSVRETTLVYLQAYRDNADLYRLATETFLIEPEVREVWGQTREMFYSRIERTLRRGQEQAVARGDFDPRAAAVLLGGMTEHYAFLAYVFDRPVPNKTVDEMADEISALWAHGVFINSDLPPATNESTAQSRSPATVAETDP